MEAKRSFVMVKLAILTLALFSTAIQAAPLPRAEYVYQALNIVDAVQTIDCLNRNVCHEGNPLLGKRPSAINLVGFKLSAGGLHYLITRILMRGDPRNVRIWEIGTIAIQSGTVVANMRFAF